MNILMNTIEYKTYLHTGDFSFFLTAGYYIKKHPYLFAFTLLELSHDAHFSWKCERVTGDGVTSSIFHTWLEITRTRFPFHILIFDFLGQTDRVQGQELCLTNGDATSQPFMSHYGNGDEHESNLDLNSKKLFLETDHHHLPLGQGWKWSEWR